MAPKAVFTVEQIAQVAHEANAAYCRTIGDYSQLPWDDAPDWQKESAIKGVQFAIENPGAPASAQHDAWLRDKIADGWKYGPVKNPETKEHPCVVSFLELPAEQRTKDYLFRAVVEAFARSL